jgi:hypothetical protein
VRLFPFAATCLVALAASGTAAAERDDKKRDAEEAEDFDSEWFWMLAEGGVQTIDLRTFQADVDRLAVGFARGTGVGPAAGVGLGARLAFVTLGVRGRFASFRDEPVATTAGAWQLWSLDGEVGFRFPIRRVQPHLTFAAGYTGTGNLGRAADGLTEGLDVSGANARVGLGVDYYVTPLVSIGAQATGEVIALSRPGVPLRDLVEAKRVGTIDEAEARVLEGEGSSVGSSFTFTAGPGLHF